MTIAFVTPNVNAQAPSIEQNGKEADVDEKEAEIDIEEQRKAERKQIRNIEKKLREVGRICNLKIIFSLGQISRIIRGHTVMEKISKNVSGQIRIQIVKNATICPDNR